MKMLPPDNHHKSLAREVNAKLKPLDTTVTFFLFEENERIHYGVVFKCGNKSEVQKREDAFFDPDRLVNDARRWCSRAAASQRWVPMEQL